MNDAASVSSVRWRRRWGAMRARPLLRVPLHPLCPRAPDSESAVVKRPVGSAELAAQASEHPVIHRSSKNLQYGCRRDSQEPVALFDHPTPFGFAGPVATAPQPRPSLRITQISARICKHAGTRCSLICTSWVRAAGQRGWLGDHIWAITLVQWVDRVRHVDTHCL